MRLQDKVALITGSGSGIGRAVATLFAKEGAKVAVNDVNETGGKETVDLIKQKGAEATFYKADVTKPGEVSSMIIDVISKYHRIDVLHNNAGGWSREVSDTVTADSEE